MKRREGDILACFVGDTDAAIVVPCSGEVDKLYRAVLGAGAAQKAAQVWPEIPRVLGKLIDTCGNHCFVLPVTRQKKEWTVSFPIRVKAKQKPSITLIERSAFELASLADLYQWERVFLPRVGCERGGLVWEKDVRPVLNKHLDDRFTVVYSETEEAVKSAPKNRKPVSNRMKVTK